MEKQGIKTKTKDLGFTFGAWLMMWHWNSSCFRKKLSATENLLGSKLPWLFAADTKKKLMGCKFKMAFGDVLVFPRNVGISHGLHFFQITN